MQDEDDKVTHIYKRDSLDLGFRGRLRGRPHVELAAARQETVEDASEGDELLNFGLACLEAAPDSEGVLELRAVVMPIAPMSPQPTSHEVSTMLFASALVRTVSPMQLRSDWMSSSARHLMEVYIVMSPISTARHVPNNSFTSSPPSEQSD
eukprot:CAMPEP_0179029728 /NCGR_PEP_ID=MMETSP0796-20121207/10206_1 /TAXON_ID=73915 /ORGANISM="Pyrodinium bahamense, Strain pbaha01" /LENGTH=150 /DNA_ID=CAMNT_0020725901 /DNA_START=149 /DNA_END=599 /DNA_ORIENTATION=+